MVRAAMRPLAFLEQTNVGAGPKGPLFLFSISVGRRGDEAAVGILAAEARSLFWSDWRLYSNAGRQQELAEHPIMVQSWSDPSRRALREE